MRQLAIAIWDVLLLLNQFHDYRFKLRQRLVDLVRLLWSSARFEAFTSSKIDEIDVADEHERVSTIRMASDDLEASNGMRAAGAFIGRGGCGSALFSRNTHQLL